jgi:hypothetical protein
MELEKQVCSLELAKRLKDLGVKQGSEYWWVMQKKVGSSLNDPYLEHHYVFMSGWGEPTIYSYERVALAFAVAKLGEMLHQAFAIMIAKRVVVIDPRGRWKRLVKTVNQMQDEVDARAKMLVYLLENHLVGGERA